ncbi:MAG: hypothetical protein BWY82_02060 [Verrucomicrobia bacterium ADurb.Bin474]|nr:MAG: hypothetical protein BWY82_02060 [Verrucomicrobia bacterium ADurb.Bin474]
MNSTETNDIRVCLGRLIRQAQRIPDVVPYLLNLPFLIIMNEDNRILFLLEFEDSLLHRTQTS